MDVVRNTTAPHVHAKQQLVVLAMDMYGLSREKAVEYVSKAYRELDTEEQVVVNFNAKDENGDMFVTSAPIEEYVEQCIKADTVMVPTWTTYSKDLTISAPEVEIVDEKMKDRRKQKAAAFKALMKKDMLEYAMQNTLQIGSKTVSNALSGAVSVGGTSVQNPSSHPTSTSTARISTSTPNASIERFISGLMHFKDVNSTLGYFAALKMTLVKPDVYNKIRETMRHHNLVYPTVEDLRMLLLECTKDYWLNDEWITFIMRFIEKQDKVILAGMYYNGSLFYLHKKNPDYIINWLKALGQPSKCQPSEDDIAIIKGIDETLHNTLVHIFNKELKGVTHAIEDYDKELLADMAATVRNYTKHVDAFSDIIDVFFKPHILAPNVGDYKEMVRSSIIVNDTDSGIFHLGIWIEKLMGSAHIINDQSRRYCGVFAHLTHIVYRHAMDILTWNMNVHNPKKRNIDMKSEFTFSMLALPSASKHYYADVSIIEGNVLPTSKLEQKGVGLRNAATPELVRKIAMDIEKDIPVALEKDGHIDVYKYLNLVANLERVIERGSLVSADYYHTIDIKSEDAQNAIWKDLWNETKLGRDNPVTIPCELIKIPTTLTTKNKTLAWLESIEDKELSDDIVRWLKQQGKVCIPRLYIPKEMAVSLGLPDVIQDIISSREVVLGNVKMLYIVLETMGIFKNEKHTLLETWDPGEPYPFLKT